MNGGQGGAGRGLHLDLNQPPADPEVAAPYAYFHSKRKLSEIMMGMQTPLRDDLLPGYDAVPPNEREAYVNNRISCETKPPATLRHGKGS